MIKRLFKLFFPILAILLLGRLQFFCSAKTLGESTLPLSSPIASSKVAPSSSKATSHQFYDFLLKDKQINAHQFSNIAVQNIRTSSGNWGSVSWTFDSASGSLTFTSGGTLGGNTSSPWNRRDTAKIDPNQIKKIIFEESVTAPSVSTRLFSSFIEDTQEQDYLTNLQAIDGFEKVDVSGVSSINSMFQGAKNLSSITFGPSFASATIRYMDNVFAGDSSLTSLDLSQWSTSSVTSMSNTFLGITSLKSLKLGTNFKFLSGAALPDVPSNSQYTGKWQNIGRGTSELPAGSNIWSSSDFMTNYDGSKDANWYVWQPAGLWGTAPYKWDKSSGTLTIGAGDLQQVSLAPYQTGDINKDNIKKISFTDKVIAPVDSSNMFDNLTNLTSIEDLTNLDTSNVTNMNSMFRDLWGVTNLDLSNFKTSNVKDMSGMFWAARNLTNLNLSNFKTSKVTNMEHMFDQLSKLTSLNLSSFNTTNVTNMTYMFWGALSLKNLNLSCFNTSKVTNMSYMFWGATGISSLDISYFDTSEATDMSNMFTRTSNLQFLKLGTNFKFLSGAALPDVPSNSQYTGKWQNIGRGTSELPAGSNMWSSSDFMTNYDGSKDADWYVWQPNGLYLNQVAQSFDFPTVTIQGSNQTINLTQKNALSLTDALSSGSTTTDQLLVAYDTPNDEWQNANLTLHLEPTVSQAYVTTQAVDLDSSPQAIITKFDESQKKEATLVNLDLDLSLEVPQGLQAKTYSTTIDWILQQVPDK